MWAEVYDLFKHGEKWHLAPAEERALHEHNEMHTASDPIEDRILDKFDLQAATGQRFMTFVEVARALGILEPTKKDLIMIGSALRKAGGLHVSKSNGRKGFKLKLLDQPTIMTASPVHPKM